MTIFDTSAYANVLKIKYGPKLVSQVSDKVTALKMFGDSRDEWEGLQVQYPVLVGRGQSFMAHGSLGILPTPQNEQTFSTIIPVRWVRGRIQFEIAVMKASMRSSGAFARANDTLMTRLVTNLADEKNRYLSSGYGAGTLALVNGAGNDTTTLTVDSPGGIQSSAYGARYLQPGMVIALHNGTTISAIRQIVAVLTDTASSATIQVDAPLSATEAPDNALIVRAANNQITNLTRDTSYLNEPMGLEGIIDDGTLVNPFHNISRTAVPDWQSTVLTDTALSLDLLQRLDDTVDQQSGQSITDYLVHHSVRRLYFALVDSIRTFMQTDSAAKMFDIGQEPMGFTPTYNNRPIHADKDVHLGRVLGLNRDHLTRYVLVDGEWAEETGSMFRAVAGQDALEAMYRCADNYSTDQPNSMGKITGLVSANAIGRHVA